MKKNLLTLAGATALALGLGACAYDPYYSGNTRTSVAVGHGYGHGYGGSSFSTSFFWSTGDPRWGYDPYARAYYDHHRRAYYDPYLYGYYPVGYRPALLIGVPHPTGYRHGWCPPPRRVTNVTVVNYRNRQSAYRNTDYGWAQNVRYDSRHQTSGTHTRNRDDRRSHGDSTNWGGRGTSRGSAGTPTTSATGSRNQWDAGNRGRTDWQNRNTSPQPSTGRSQAPPRQSYGRPTSEGRGSQPQGAPTRSHRGIPDDRGVRQAQPPTTPSAPAGRRHTGSPSRAEGFQPQLPPQATSGGRRHSGSPPRAGGFQPTIPPAAANASSRGGRGGRSEEFRQDSGRGGRR